MFEQFWATVMGDIFYRFIAAMFVVVLTFKLIDGLLEILAFALSKVLIWIGRKLGLLKPEEW